MTTLDRIAVVMSCDPTDEDDLIEAVRMLVAEPDDAIAARDALAGAVREYIVATDAFQSDPCASERDYVAARRAALAAAGGGW